MDNPETEDAKKAMLSVPPGRAVMTVDDAAKLQQAFLKVAEASLRMVDTVTAAQAEHNVTRADNRRTRRTIITSHVIVIGLLVIFLGSMRSYTRDQQALATRTFAENGIARDQLVATLKAVQASSVAQVAGIESTLATKALVGVRAKSAADDNAKASAVEAQAAAVSAQATLAPEPEKTVVLKKAAALTAKARTIRSEAPPAKPSDDEALILH